MGKKNHTKSDDQRLRLKQFYDKLLPNTTKEDYVKFALQIKLDVQQVYKWVWDKKNKTKIIERKKKQGEAKKKPKKLTRQLTYKSFVMTIPISKQGASQFHSQEMVVEEAKQALVCEGWQLIRQRPSSLPKIQYQESENELHFDSRYISDSLSNNQSIESKRPVKEIKRNQVYPTSLYKENKAINSNSDSLPSQLPQKGSSSEFHKNEDILFDSNQ